MVGLHPILVVDLARQHHQDLEAQARRDHFATLARLARRPAAPRAQVSIRRQPAALWHWLGHSLSRLADSENLAASGQ